MESPFDSCSSSVVALYLEPMLNSYYKSYQNILTLSNIPEGPLAKMVARVSVPKLSEFQSLSAFSPPPTSRSAYSRTCLFALCRYPTNNAQIGSKCGDYYMYAGDVPNVFGYLESNGYQIMESLTTMTNRGSVDIGVAQPGEYNGRRRLICMFRHTG